MKRLHMFALAILAISNLIKIGSVVVFCTFYNAPLTQEESHALVTAYVKPTVFNKFV